MRVFGAVLLALVAVALTPVLAISGLAFAFFGMATRLGFLFQAGMWMWAAIPLLWSWVADFLTDAR